MNPSYTISVPIPHTHWNKEYIPNAGDLLSEEDVEYQEEIEEDAEVPRA